jgi:hypothetical protein
MREIDYRWSTCKAQDLVLRQLGGLDGDSNGPQPLRGFPCRRTSLEQAPGQWTRRGPASVRARSVDLGESLEFKGIEASDGSDESEVRLKAPVFFFRLGGKGRPFS